MTKHKKRTFYQLHLIVLIILMILCLTGCNTPKTITGTTKINSLEWEVVTEIQELRSCNESGWEVPDGATVYKEQEEIKSYRTVGYETKYRIEEYQEHIGYYLPTWRPKYETRTKKVPYQEAIKEPVYATKYYYTINRWVDSINVQLARGYNYDYHNQDYTNKYVCKENERVSAITYKYLVSFKFDGHDIFYIVDYDKWKNLQVGQELYFEQNQYGTISINWENTN